MVALFSRLTLLLLVFAPALAQGAVARELCTSCHKPHYRERGSCISCHRGNPAALRKNVAHHLLIPGKYLWYTVGKGDALAGGERLMERFACRRCHVSGGKGNHLATPLDGVMRSREASAVVAAIRTPALGMPDFRLTDRELTPLINALYAGSSRAPAPVKEPPVSVHFADRAGRAQDVFSRKCGSCHRMLTSRLGLLGSGEIGPNLSGLLTPWYPPTFRGSERWNAERLFRWVENPRRIAPEARMQPVPLTAEERRELERLF
ncbi:c-type cytochrome [Geomonas sp. Red32]|uniref:selenite/tellurite reduction operon c-type cytochrome lipoprotein ExtS n=1 Tax=Geomonas sp. Red32 TaxID=2912856 RepID=UPI00202CD9D8|nr:selenite/tellurite reduction operon c-type cytochrome lipoprotein ExtS [Geomonas sp. Red32]MCM0082144.1 c-type cytochrome [Geomonas sp. Red32]